MTQIRIDTEYTREIGRRLIAEADRMAEIGRELQHAIGSLDTGAWDGRSRARAEPLLSRVRPESEWVKHQLEELGRQLFRIADAFEQADSQSAAGVDTIPWFVPESLLGWRTNPALRMGSLLAGGGAAAITLTTLPVTGVEGGVSFIERLRGIPSVIREWLSPTIVTVAGWFGWRDLISKETSWEELPPAEMLEPGKTLDGKPALPPQPLPKVSAEVTTEFLPPRFITPVMKQTEKSYECAPTAASMVLGYWHKLDPDNQAYA